MELKGQFLGCRRGNKKPSGINIFGQGDNPMSNTLAHHKSRWATKTLDENPKVSCGGKKSQNVSVRKNAARKWKFSSLA